MAVDLLPSILLLFGLGALHGLDADHVLAVSSMGYRKPGLRRIVRVSTNWALGHGLVLLVLGALLFGFGIQLPQVVQASAELAVGVLLIALGLACFNLWQPLAQWCSRQLRRAGLGSTEVAELKFSDADGSRSDVRRPRAVGFLHGLAGSAPALALLPAATANDPLYSYLGLLVFSIGLLLMMLCFGLGLARLQHYFQQWDARLFHYQRALVALASIAFGCYWVARAL